MFFAGRHYAAIVIALTVVACKDVLTETPSSADIFDSPLPGLTDTEAAVFARGDAEFSRRFSPASGLGPIFNNASCFSCHSGDGRGRIENSLQRIGSEDDDFLAHLGGPQIQDKAIPGAEFERVPPDVPVSVRLPPPVFGVGLIEAIPAAAILALADPADADGDGISGRANMVLSPAFVPSSEPGAGPGQHLGRFGRKAQTSSLAKQVIEAYLQDIGVTSDFVPHENRNPLSSVPVEAVDRVADPEIPASTVLATVHYIRTLAPSAPGEMTPQREEGRRLFSEIGCAKCHTPSFTTGQFPIAALSGKEVTLYSDLLLHDMGDELADNRSDGMATGREWRTTPLWGLRLMRNFLNGQAFLLHDGRARNVEEAILLHGGEARPARDRFAATSGASRTAILDFVESR
jgi:CxxC motif-containing protein (DUF1111 family)